MLSSFDDYPVHQTPEPVAHPASSDRNVYDRYWLNGYDRDGGFYFGVGMGLYPNRRILDGAFSIVRGGEQHAFHVSRRAPEDPRDTSAGPFRIEVVEPMRRVRVVLKENDTGIACDLRFTARTAAVEEGRQTARRDGRIMMDATRFAQFGSWEGWVRYAGQELRVEPQRVPGTKDRSWGIRPVGEPEAGGAPSEASPQFFFLWSPIHWRDHCTHFGVFEDADGIPWHTDGAIVPVYEDVSAIPTTHDPGIVYVPRVEHRLTYEPGTRRASAAEIALIERSGERHEIALEPLICFRMKGLGYTHPEWGHGRWKGELAWTGESWKTDTLDPLAFENLHVQQVVRARKGDQEGVGVLEQFAIGPHHRYGFRELVDGARV
ncbi:MAG: hypothetical protein R3263_06350 [Myxococcota bacterium]|nr:hypothetical protein [Myxococcota bacterium]